ncbi:hypothetical protein DFH06DRAFT_143706 [Mycena polygramma]|nr:hypothetical protein DFH06DRAFT_143706 [Mycena polygramma]
MHNHRLNIVGEEPACSAWIRISTGRLCVDLDETAENFPLDLKTHFIEDVSLCKLFSALTVGTDTEIRLRSILQLDDIHEILRNAGEKGRVRLPLQCSVQLGQVASTDFTMDLGLHLPLFTFTGEDPMSDVAHWYTDDASLPDNAFHVLDKDNDWTRVTLPTNTRNDLTLRYTIGMDHFLQYIFEESWLSQANWSFSQLQGSGRVEGILDSSFYLCTEMELEIRVEFPDAPRAIGILPYLFLNRPTGELIDDRLVVRTPPVEHLFYWSHGPFGTPRLSDNDSSVESLGLPVLTCSTVTSGPSWNPTQYQCLRAAHKAKGFDFDGRLPTVAMSLGYPPLIPEGDSD